MQSLFGLMDRCRSSVGRRTLRLWLLNPLTSVPAIRNRQQVVAWLSGLGAMTVHEMGAEQLKLAWIKSVTEVKYLYCSLLCSCCFSNSPITFRTFVIL